MPRPLEIGNSDFRSYRINDYYYVDKSLFIKELFQAQSQVMLITRPRRFGKTLNISMLRYFFDIQHPENRQLFKGLAIERETEIMQRHCCQYPVIFISLRQTKGENWQQIFEKLQWLISGLFSEYDFLVESNTIDSEDRKKFQRIVNMESTSVDLQMSLYLLSKLLFEYYQKPVVILIDEYDVPIHSAFPEFYDKVVNFMRGFLTSALKDNQFLFKAVLTGILRVSKESIFSDLNNLAVYTVLSSKFADKFGFTEAEVKQILSDFGLSEYFDQVKAWYNGYRFGKLEGIYNPWSVLNFVSNPGDGPKLYWINTSSNDLIIREIKLHARNDMEKTNGLSLWTKLQKLIENKTVEEPIEENFVFKDLERRPELLWSLLLFSGYLTFTDYEPEEEFASLRIPNREVKRIYSKIFLSLLEEEYKYQGAEVSRVVRALVRKNYEAFAEGLTHLLMQMLSFFDLTREREKIYQGFLLGLFAHLAGDYYIKSNRESGQGRYDIAIFPRQGQTQGWIMELKAIEKQGKDETWEHFRQRIDKALDEALQQIERLQYVEELRQAGVSRIDRIAIVFAGKQAFVKVKSD